MSRKPTILTEAPNASDLEPQSDISLKTHDARLDLTQRTMLAALTREISVSDAKIVFQAIDLASRLQDRVEKSEQEVAKVILQLGENVKEDLREELEEKLAEFEVQ